MASRDLADLLPELRAKAEAARKSATELGIELLIYCTWRSVEDQARLYRQSRSRKQIDNKAEWFRRRGFDPLAEVLVGVGPQPGKLGRHVTMAAPGESWHGYRRAFDAVPVVDGKAMWSKTHPHWQEYGRIVRTLDLEWAGDWTRFCEFPHSQIPAEGSPLAVLSPEQVERMLKAP